MEDFFRYSELRLGFFSFSSKTINGNRSITSFKENYITRFCSCSNSVLLYSDNDDHKDEGEVCDEPEEEYENRLKGRLTRKRLLKDFNASRDGELRVKSNVAFKRNFNFNAVVSPQENQGHGGGFTNCYLLKRYTTNNFTLLKFFVKKGFKHHIHSGIFTACIDVWNEIKFPFPSVGFLILWFYEVFSICILRLKFCAYGYLLG